MLQVSRSPFTTPTTKVLEEDVGRSVSEDERAFDEFS